VHVPALPSRALARALAVTLAVALLLLVAGPALAHVTLRTDNPSAGGFAVYTVRVPNEEDAASTTTVEVQMPDGFEASRYEPVDGWDIALEDGVLTISGGTIEPGQFREFRFQARNPEEPGVLTFPSLQTYDSGLVVEWTGPEDSDTPAPTVELVEAAGDGHGGDGHGASAGTEAAAEGATEGATEAEVQLAADPAGPGDAQPASSTSSTSPVVWIALVASLLALGLAAASLRRGRAA
jgi:uncharacterized protein YcnI